MLDPSFVDDDMVSACRNSRVNACIMHLPTVKESHTRDYNKLCSVATFIGMSKTKIQDSTVGNKEIRSY